MPRSRTRCFLECHANRLLRFTMLKTGRQARCSRRQSGSWRKFRIRIRDHACFNSHRASRAPARVHVCSLSLRSSLNQSWFASLATLPSFSSSRVLHWPASSRAKSSPGSCPLLGVLRQIQFDAKVDLLCMFFLHGCVSFMYGLENRWAVGLVQPHFSMGLHS